MPSGKFGTHKSFITAVVVSGAGSGVFELTNQSRLGIWTGLYGDRS